MLPQPCPHFERVSEIFGRIRVRLDLEGQKMWATENSLGYVFYVLSYVAVTNTNASDPEKTDRLIAGFPWALKAYFVRDTPQMVQAFTERLKSVAVEHVYKQATAYGGTSPASLPAPANAETAAVFALALQRLFLASRGQVTVPA